MTSTVVSPGFQFSQSSLRDYEVCRRRFYLRYVEGMAWPAPITAQTARWEAAIERGRRFHELARQDALGVDVTLLIADSDDPLLQEWWHNYRLHPPDVPSGKVYSEVELSVPLAGPADDAGSNFRLGAKLDRLVIGSPAGRAGRARVVIVDWKTGEKVPELSALQQSWQTIVYRYVVVEGGHRLTDDTSFGRITPDDVSLLYWYARAPNAVPPIGYSQREHERARERLAAMIRQIAGLQSEADFAKTDDRSECERCQYRSYCGRGAASSAVRGRVAADDWEIREDELTSLDLLFDLEE